MSGWTFGKMLLWTDDPAMIILLSYDMKLVVSFALLYDDDTLL